MKSWLDTWWFEMSFLYGSNVLIETSRKSSKNTVRFNHFLSLILPTQWSCWDQYKDKNSNSPSVGQYPKQQCLTLHEQNLFLSRSSKPLTWLMHLLNCCVIQLLLESSLPLFPLPLFPFSNGLKAISISHPLGLPFSVFHFNLQSFGSRKKTSGSSEKESSWRYSSRRIFKGRISLKK